jgi:hypothetical protein
MQRADTEAPHCRATAALEVEIATPRQSGELLPVRSDPPRPHAARDKTRVVVG